MPGGCNRKGCGFRDGGEVQRRGGEIVRLREPTHSQKVNAEEKLARSAQNDRWLLAQQVVAGFTLERHRRGAQVYCEYGGAIRCCDGLRRCVESAQLVLCVEEGG